MSFLKVKGVEHPKTKGKVSIFGLVLTTIVGLVQETTGQVEELEVRLTL